MATENIKYSGGVIFASRFTPTGKQPLDTRTIVTSLPAYASDFESSAAYEGMIVSLLPEHKLFMLTSSLEDILANEQLQWKEVGAEQEIPSLDGYATEEYVDNAVLSYVSAVEEYVDNLVSSYISAVEEDVDNVRTLAQTAYDMAYTIAYGEGVADAIDTIKDITYWLNNDPENAVDLITRMSKVEEELGSLHNYDDSEVRGLINDNADAIKANSDLITANANAIKANADNIALHEESISDINNEISYINDDINTIYSKIQAIESNGYDDSEVRGLINDNADAIKGNSDLIKANSDAIDEIKKIDLEDNNFWKNDQTGEALIVTYIGEEKKEILSISDYTSYIQSSCSLTWDIL